MVSTEVLGVIMGHRLGLDIASLDLLTVNDTRDFNGASGEHLVHSGLETSPLSGVGRVVPHGLIVDDGDLEGGKLGRHFW